MKRRRYLELDSMLTSMAFGEIMQTWVSLEELDFMVANADKTIDEIKFEE